VIEEYVQWLIRVYEAKSGIILDGPNVVHDAIGILRRHLRRWPDEEDFVSLVTTEMVDRLQARADNPTPMGELDSFRKMLDRSADAVRHRIVREARKRMNISSGESIDQVASPEEHRRDMISRSLADGLAARLRLEEQTVLSLFLDGVPIDQVARDLNVSVRTIYRRLEGIRQQIARDESS
jgi:DNA-directed RNA polymerase specialized sigma24 family protein